VHKRQPVSQRRDGLLAKTLTAPPDRARWFTLPLLPPRQKGPPYRRASPSRTALLAVKLPDLHGPPRSGVSCGLHKHMSKPQSQYAKVRGVCVDC